MTASFSGPGQQTLQPVFRAGAQIAGDEPREAREVIRSAPGDDYESRRDGFSIERPARIARRSFSLPVRAARRSIRPLRRRYSRFAGNHWRSVSLDAHREAPGVRRSTGVQQVAGLVEAACSRLQASTATERVRVVRDALLLVASSLRADLSPLRSEQLLVP